jgi:hypothetical protein
MTFNIGCLKITLLLKERKVGKKLFSIGYLIDNRLICVFIILLLKVHILQVNIRQYCKTELTEIP